VRADFAYAGLRDEERRSVPKIASSERELDVDRDVASARVREHLPPKNSPKYREVEFDASGRLLESLENSRNQSRESSLRSASGERAA